MVQFFTLLLLAISSGMLAVLVVSKKLSFVADSISHSILLGFSLSILFSLNQNFVIIVFVIFFASLIHILSKNSYFSKDAIIAVLTYSCLALSIIINHFLKNEIDFLSLFFGKNIADINQIQLIISLICLIFTTIFIKLFFNDILLSIINKDLALTGCVKINLIEVFINIFIAFYIIAAAKIIGILLVSISLILPAMIARIFANSPYKMLFLSIIFSLIATIISFLLSAQFLLPYSSVNVIILSITFFISLIFFKKI